MDDANLENADMEEVFASEATKTKNITNNFKAGVDGVGLDK
ncbi:25577_t:CDS:1, partial [Racocetra persica]